MATQERPLSPHLQVYRPQLTSVMSILHRGTGVVLALGSLVFAGWLVAAATGAEAFAAYSAVLASVPGKIALFGFSACLVYHFLNGIRHLAWDAGHGYEIPKAYASGYAVAVLAVVLTAVLWYVGLTAGGAA
ncbi:MULTISPECIES: succinate dehydrogenase, cytochrome b556 subunit [unclassified Arenimonas]|uniref:succinate dehydrogenase, cytochrome b556 subunit n=1 Tax=unclassified Arenimonas TaxID=2641713 RepID=UPI000868452D|nr:MULTISPECIES: succinate dehydrogenase, cytochrome b556 subunit [unclassified Arenimonas]ODS61543.1 MAG: succinate dehydrogenase, cytochrome b556 subunit [Arenimonas sp. SCN 70-307]